MTSLTCPHCKQDDALRMVSAVYFAHQTALAHHQPISEQDIELAQQLAPPAPPKPLLSWAFIILIQLVLLGLFAMAIEFIQTYQKEFLNLCATIFLLFGLTLNSFFFSGSARLKRTQKRENLYSLKKRVWGRLYYCSRDHLVFDTRTPVRGHPKDLNRLIDQIIKSS